MGVSGLDFSISQFFSCIRSRRRVSEQVKTSYIANLRGYLEKSFRNAMAEQGLRERLLSMGDLFFDEREDIMIAAALDKQ